MLGTMTTFLIEAYLADGPTALEDACGAARRAADGAAGIRYLRSTFVPRDETVFHVFEARSATALLEAARTAALTVDRIGEAIDEPARVGAPD